MHASLSLAAYKIWRREKKSRSKKGEPAKSYANGLQPQTQTRGLSMMVEYGMNKVTTTTAPRTVQEKGEIYNEFVCSIFDLNVLPSPFTGRCAERSAK